MYVARASNSCEIEQRTDGLIKELKKERTDTNRLMVVLAMQIFRLESKVYGHPGCAGHCAYPGCAGGCAPQNREKETQCQEVDAETEEEECEIDDSLPSGSSNSLMSRISGYDDDKDDPLAIRCAGGYAPLGGSIHCAMACTPCVCDDGVPMRRWLCPTESIDPHTVSAKKRSSPL